MEIKNKTYEPYISYIPQDNFIFSILDEKKMEDFILENYLDIYSIKIDRCYDYIYRFSNFYSSITQSKNFKFDIINYETIKNNNINITEFIKKKILNNYCLLVSVDISKIDVYKKDEIIYHEVMIFGFNDNLNEFYIKDFFDGNIYKESKCYFSEMEEAFSSFSKKDHSNFGGIICLKNNESKTINNKTIDLKKILYMLKNFMAYKLNDNEEKNYGFSIFYAFIKQLEIEQVDYAPFNFILDKLCFIRAHIMLMKVRINSLLYISEDLNSYLDKINDLINEITLTINKTIKCMIKNNCYIIKRDSFIREEINEIISEYKIIINNFINVIEKNIEVING